MQLLGYNLKFTFLAAVDELAGVETLDCYEVFNALSEAVRVSEDHFGQWSSSAGVVHDVFDQSFDVATTVRHQRYSPFAFGIVESSEASGSDSLRCVRFEAGTATFPLACAW